jgi:hypothetical protein
MQSTHHPGSASVSPAGLYDTHDYTEMAGRSIASLMVEHGDQRIDLLKLDIEGGEYELMRGLDLASVGVKVFAAQLHHTGGVREAQRLIDALAGAGYVPVACKSAVKIAFVAREVLEAGAQPPAAGPDKPGATRRRRAPARSRGAVPPRPVHH